MNEVNHNAGDFDSESISPKPSDRIEQQGSSTETEISNAENASSLTERTTEEVASQAKKSVQKMNWQKVAHKLREHNRKLYKQVFRLEQELAEVSNKFDKYVEKSKSNDLLMAHQAEEIKNYQESIALFSQQLASDRQEIDSKKTVIEQLSQQYELSQKQTAQLERECTLLQERYNDRAYELSTKEQENQELRTQLEQQQQTILEYEAKQKRDREAATSSREKANRHKNYPHNRYIQPWSFSSLHEPKISLPKTKVQPLKAKQTDSKAPIVKSVAEITTSSRSAAKNQTERANTAKSSTSKKPQTLAAVDLPTFPRHR